MIGANCSSGTPSVVLPMVLKMDLQHLAQDYDQLQGYDYTTLFFPITAPRLFANVPLYMPRISKLKNKPVTCIELVDGSQLASFGGVDMPSSFTNGWLVLKDACDDIIIEVPLSRLNRVLNGGKPFFIRKAPVDWGKSFIKLTSTGGLSAAGFLFHVWTV